MARKLGDRGGMILALLALLPFLFGSTLTGTATAQSVRAADPTVRPAYPVGDPVASAAAGQQYDPAVAYDGVNYLVVWSDARSRVGEASDDLTAVYAARVRKADGVVLDPSGIRLTSTAPFDGGDPAVAFDGINFLVAWTDARAGGAVYAARVSTAGAVLDPSGTRVGVGSDPAVAYDGTNHLVVWQQGGDIRATRMNTSGAVVDASPLTIFSDQLLDTDPAVSFDGTNYLVVWERGGIVSELYRSGIFGARVSKARVVVDPAAVTIAGIADRQDPAVAFDGSNHLVAWADGTNIRGARVTTTGNVMDASGIAISSDAADQRRPAVAFNGTDLVVVWEDLRDFPSTQAPSIYGARVSKFGVLVDTTGRRVGGGADPTVVWDGSNAFVARSSADDIVGARTTAALTAIDVAAIVVSRAANSQFTPTVAFDGTNYLVVWTDTRSDAGATLFGSPSGDIYAARVSPSGTVLDRAGIAIATTSVDELRPAVSFDGSNFLVVWQRDEGSFDDASIHGALVSKEGAVLAPSSPIVVATSTSLTSGPAVSFDGSNHLVVWRGGGTRVSKLGRVLDSPAISIGSGANPAVAFDGTNHMVVWDDFGDIHRALVGVNGSVVSPASPITTSDTFQGDPAVAWNGTTYLVVWVDNVSDGSGNISADLRGTLVTTAGAVQDGSGLAISAAAGNEAAPAVAANGSFLVAWQDRRSGFNLDIYATRVDSAGVVQQQDGFPIADSVENEAAPSLAKAGGDVAVASQRFTPPAPFGATRAYVSSVAPK